MTHPYRRSRFFRSMLPEANVSEVGNIRSLHLGTQTIQSSMNLHNPTQLVLSYSQTMMAWLLFADAPRTVLQIGLGGGSFARWLAHYFPQTQQVAVEINPQVITIARNQFCLPPENECFEIVETDGAHYIKTVLNHEDVILVDGFDGVQIADELVTQEFFEDCYRALSDKGIFVTNWWSGDKRYAQFVERLREVFEGRVLEIPALSHGNMAVLAFRHAPNEANMSLEKLKKRAQQLSEELDLDFVRMLADAKARNSHNNKQFFFKNK